MFSFSHFSMITILRGKYYNPHCIDEENKRHSKSPKVTQCLNYDLRQSICLSKVWILGIVSESWGLLETLPKANVTSHPLLTSTPRQLTSAPQSWRLSLLAVALGVQRTKSLCMLFGSYPMFQSRLVYIPKLNYGHCLLSCTLNRPH